MKQRAQKKKNERKDEKFRKIRLEDDDKKLFLR